MQKNANVVESFREFVTNWQLSEDYGTPTRNHRFAQVGVDDFIDFFREIGFQDLPNIARKIATIQYLTYLKENGEIDNVVVYDMSCGVVRERSLSNGLPLNLQAGRSTNVGVAYPGDKAFKSEATITFQLHHIQIKEASSVKYRKSPFYNFAIYYPESLEQGYVATEGAEEDESDDE